MAFSGDGRLIAAGCGDFLDARSVTVFGAQPNYEILLCDLSGKITGTLQGHTDTVCSLAFDPKGKQLASASKDKTIRIWDVEARREIRKLIAPFR